MRVISENMSLYDFDAWSGAVNTKNKIIAEDKETEFEDLIDELYPNGITATELNDLLWFEDEWLFTTLCIDDEEEDEEDDDDEEEDEEDDDDEEEDEDDDEDK